MNYIIPCNSIREIGVDDINRSHEQLEKVFQEKMKNKKVFIDWFSGEFAIPKGGKSIWWDNIFTTIYDKEELYTIRKGILVDRYIVQNYQKKKGGITREKNVMSKAIFNEIKKLNWQKLYTDFFCDGMYCFEIDSRGKIINVEKENYGIELDEDHIYCLKVIKNQLKKCNLILSFIMGDLLMIHFA